MIANYSTHNEIIDKTGNFNIPLHTESSAAALLKKRRNPVTVSTKLRLQTERSFLIGSKSIDKLSSMTPSAGDALQCPTTPRSSSNRCKSPATATGTTTTRKIPFPSFVQEVTPSVHANDFLADIDGDQCYSGTEEKKAHSPSKSFGTFPSFFQQEAKEASGEYKRKLCVEGSLFDLSDSSSSPHSDPEMKKMRKLSLDDLAGNVSFLEDQLVLTSIISLKQNSKEEDRSDTIPPPTPLICRSRSLSKPHLVTPSRASLFALMSEEDTQLMLTPLNLSGSSSVRQRAVSYDEQELEVAKVLVSSEFFEVDKPCPVLGTDIVILESLGMGSFAEVSKVVFANRRFAMKQLKKPFRSNKDRERITQEAVIMKTLTQSSMPYIVEFHGAWQCEGRFHMLMDCSECGSVKDLIHEYHRRGVKIPDSVMWHVIHDVCSALSHMHSLGYVHLDIKPANLLMFEDGTIKVSDFGLTTHIGVDRDEQEGDPRYMAKELLNSNIRDSSADVFSLGISLFEMASIHNHSPSMLNTFTPRPIFTLPTEGQGWHDLRNGVNVYVDNRPFAFNLLVLAMMNPLPCTRPKAADIVTLPDVQAFKLEPELIEIYATSPTRLIKPVFNRSSSFDRGQTSTH